MKNFTMILAIAAALAIVGCKQDNTVADFEKEMNAYVDSVGVVGMSLAVVKDNKLIYSQSYGVKDITTGEPVDENTIFRIASISKSFTSTSLLQLVEQGRIGLKDDVSELIGYKVRNPKFPDTVITLEMLLSHTSSINDSQGYWQTIDIINPECNPDYALCYNDYEPGKGYEYCNLNLNMAGTILERVSGERFDQYVVHHILEPLGLYGGYCVDSLDASRFGHIYEWDSEKGEFVDTYPDSYNPRSEKVANYTMGHDALIFSPTGGMKISALDLAKYMMMHLNYGTSPLNGARIISEELSKDMQTPRSSDENYGLSLWKDDAYSAPGVVLTGHTGGAYGLRSLMFFDPEKKFGYTVICSGCKVDDILNGSGSIIYRHFIAQ